jgi:hypothetical protein
MQPMTDTTPNGHAPPVRNREQRRAGYRRKTRQLRLTFEGSNLDGLEALMRSVPVGSILDLADLSDMATEFTPEGLKKLGEVFELLAQALISWNLEDELCDAHAVNECEECPPGAPTTIVPVPATLEGVRTLDMADALLLVQQWTQHAAGVAGPLDRSSSDGRPSAVASLPMDVESPNRPS